MLEQKSSPWKVILIALIAIAILGGALYFWKTKKSEMKPEEIMMKQENQQSETEIAALSEESDEPAQMLQEEDEEFIEEKTSPEQPDENMRQSIISYINQNLNQLVPPPANDKWDVTDSTFYFVGNTHVYLELYALETDLAGFKLLYQVDKDEKGNIKLTELAKYKEDEEEWVLSQGKDEFDDYSMDDYEYNEKDKKWEKTDEFIDEEFIDEEMISDEEADEEDTEQTPIIR